MDWTDLGGSLIRAGAPIIGTAIGGPFGGMIGNTLGSVLAGALGTSQTPEAVNSAIQNTAPEVLQEKLTAAEAEAQAKWPALAEMAKADADAEAQAINALQVTARAEVVAGDPIQRWWRPFYAIELTFECMLVWVLLLGSFIFSDGHYISLLTQNSGLIIAYWGARFGVLGVYAGGRSFEKTAAINSPLDTLLTPAVVDKLVKLAKRK